MTAKPRIDIEITADSSGARSDLDKSGTALDKFKDHAKTAGTAALGAIGGLVALGVGTVDAAADMERASVTVGRVFGDASAAVKSFADTSAQRVGISSEAYLSMAGKIGTSLKGMGLSVDEAALKSDELLVVAGDMALALGTDVPTATEALAAGLRGEFDALSEFGVKVDDATVKAGLAAKGISGPEGMDQAAYDAAYQQELLNQVLGGAAGVYGGYRSETDTTTERTEALKAEFENTKAMLGEQLLPVFDTAATKLSEFVGWVDDNKEAIVKWLPWVAGAALAVWALNWALAANPIVLVTIGVLAAAAAIYYFREAIYNWAISALTALNDALGSGEWWGTQFQEALGFLGLSADDFATTIDNISSALSDLWGWFSRNWSLSLPSVPLTPPGRSSGGGGPFAVTLAPDVGLRAAGVEAAGTVPAYASGGMGAGVIINVSGALDPDAVARQIESILRGRGRRSGSVNL